MKISRFLSFSCLFNKIKTTLIIFLLLLPINTQLFAAEGFSEVNNALFDSPHMKSIKTPGKINYQYKFINADKETREDSVILDITNISENGHTDQSYSFFTGDNKKQFPTLRNIKGNGILMMFLERDVHQLEQQTEGSWRHFQRRIRWAMAAGANKKEVDINYKGKKIKGIQYSIQPYANDKKSERYGAYVSKYYLFTLADDIPGTIYEVRTIVPKAKDWKEGDDVIADEQLRFTSFTQNPL